ncbi:MAG: SDR family NAD(P)-dependent oxidoreductase, partial [Anaerolineales bacterium]
MFCILGDPTNFLSCERVTTMKSFFTNKVAIISGASSGVGRETARLLADQGARVVLAARSAEALEHLAREISQNSGQALAVSTDVTQKDQVERL